jgi:hypothetical protein
MYQPPSTSQAVSVDTRELFTLYASGEHAKLTDMFRSVFDYFNKTTYLDGNSANVLHFFKTFLPIFTQPDYRIPEQHGFYFVSLNELISKPPTAFWKRCVISRPIW